MVQRMRHSRAGSKAISFVVIGSQARVPRAPATVDPVKRINLVQAVTLKLQQNGVRPILHLQMHAACQ